MAHVIMFLGWSISGLAASWTCTLKHPQSGTTRTILEGEVGAFSEEYVMRQVLAMGLGALRSGYHNIMFVLPLKANRDLFHSVLLSEERTTGHLINIPDDTRSFGDEMRSVMRRAHTKRGTVEGALLKESLSISIDLTSLPTPKRVSRKPATETQFYTAVSWSAKTRQGRWGLVRVSLPDDSRVEWSGGAVDTTNNQLELYASMYALDKLQEQSGFVVVFTTSRYLVDVGNYRGWHEANMDILTELYSLIERKKLKVQFEQINNSDSFHLRAKQLALTGESLMPFSIPQQADIDWDRMSLMDDTDP